MNDTQRQKGIALLKDFEHMRDMAEIKALSNLSLEQPLNDEQFARIMELKEKLFGGN